MADTTTRYPRAWCPSCKAVHKARLSEMKAGGENKTDAADLVCVECHTIIATLYA